MIELDAWRAKGKWFDYDGNEIFYLDDGSGDALICVHGFATASWDWSWIWQGLTDRFRVIAPGAYPARFKIDRAARRRDGPHFDRAVRAPERRTLTRNGVSPISAHDNLGPVPAPAQRGSHS